MVRILREWRFVNIILFLGFPQIAFGEIPSDRGAGLLSQSSVLPE